MMPQKKERPVGRSFWDEWQSVKVCLTQESRPFLYRYNSDTTDLSCLFLSYLIHTPVIPDNLDSLWPVVG